MLKNTFIIILINLCLFSPLKGYSQLLPSEFENNDRVPNDTKEKIQKNTYEYHALDDDNYDLDKSSLKEKPQKEMISSKRNPHMPSIGFFMSLGINNFKALTSNGVFSLFYEQNINSYFSIQLELGGVVYFSLKGEKKLSLDSVYGMTSGVTLKIYPVGEYFYVSTGANVLHSFKTVGTSSNYAISPKLGIGVVFSPGQVCNFFLEAQINYVASGNAFSNWSTEKTDASLVNFQFLTGVSFNLF